MLLDSFLYFITTYLSLYSTIDNTNYSYIFNFMYFYDDNWILVPLSWIIVSMNFSMHGTILPSKWISNARAFLAFTILQKGSKVNRKKGAWYEGFLPCVQKNVDAETCAKALHVLLAQAMHFCVWKCWSTTREPCSSSRTDYDGFSQKSLKTFFFTLLGVADFYVTTRYPASHYIKFFKSPPFNRSHFLKSSLGTL